MITWTKITIWLKRNFWDLFFVLIFLSICVFISFKNYSPGTWLTGWDNLHPEFNFYLNIKRSFFAVWQEYQGLGLLAGMGHAADLPRQLILWVFSYFIPVNFLRYFWTYLMLTIGPVGVYFLVSKKLVAEDHGFLAKISGFVAGIFYLFNLATLQTFYTPFETFTAFYGLFPWLLYFAINYLKTGKNKSLLAYFIFAAVAVCAFYVQTMFVVWTIFLTIIAFETVLTSSKNGFVLSIKLALTTLCVNAFWLLPVIYFAVTGASVTTGSHINSIVTPENQLVNQARGTLPSIATLKGYWFDYYDWNQTLNDGGSRVNYDYLYRDWINYLGMPHVNDISLAIFYLAAAGLVLAVFKKKITYRFSFLVLGLASYFMLAGSNPPFGDWFEFVRNNVPLFGEIFRNAFTKWGVATSLIYSIGLGYFVYIVSSVFKSKFKYFLAILVSIVIVSGSIYVVFPFFQGSLISQSMRVDIPQDYFDLFKFFNTQDKTKRIANFPQLNFWGWNFDRWGYKGSGFVWYGIEQPIVDRAFDVWSPYNEAFYKEANFAIAYGTVFDFEQVLAKYQISYILFDESIYDPGNPNSNILVQKQKEILESSKLITKNKSFGKIVVYDVGLNSQVQAFVSAPGKSSVGVPLAAVSDSGLLPPQGVPAIMETFPSLQGYQTPKNCDLKGNGVVTKESTDQGNVYSANSGGVSCDYFYYPTIDYAKTYVMHLVGQNMSGRSLKFYLFNVKSGNIDREELLPSGNFDNYYLIMPTGTGKKIGYTLNVETRSYGNIDSNNKLEKIEFYSVDENYLAGLVAPSPEFENNNLKVANVQKHGTWLYKIDVQNWGLIQLGQGYDKGWEAFAITNYQLPIINRKVELPDFSKRLEHVKVSGWSNGWTVDSSDCSQMENGNCQLIIVFWPQLLEWGGAFLGIISLIFIALKHRKDTYNT